MRQFAGSVGSYFLGKLRKNISLLSAESAHSVVSDKYTQKKKKQQKTIE